MSTSRLFTITFVLTLCAVDAWGGVKALAIAIAGGLDQTRWRVRSSASD